MSIVYHLGQKEYRRSFNSQTYIFSTFLTKTIILLGWLVSSVLCLIAVPLEDGILPRIV